MSVEFDPVRLGQGRGRLEPVVIGVVVMAVAILLAIAKPWEPPATSPSPAASVGAILPTGSSASSLPVVAPRATPSTPDWTDAVAAITRHQTWGIAAVLVVRRGSSGIPVSPLSPRYMERWSPTTEDASGADVAYVDREDQSIAALGVSLPDGLEARSVRVWRLHVGDELEWMHTARVDAAANGGTPLLARQPLAEDGAVRPWDAGRYRVDVLTGDGIHRIAVHIPNRFGNVPPPDAWERPASKVVAASSSDPSGVQLGLFATVDGTAISIPARESEPLGEVQAWADVVGAGGSTVATAYLPRATGLGVMLRQHAAVRAASIRRLAPGPLPDPPPAFGGISNMRGRTPYVVFAAPGGGVWPPGIYAVAVEWEDAAGRHYATWHVELRPGID